jgi:hypothetical protein
VGNLELDESWDKLLSICIEGDEFRGKLAFSSCSVAVKGVLSHHAREQARTG